MEEYCQKMEYCQKIEYCQKRGHYRKYIFLEADALKRWEWDCAKNRGPADPQTPNVDVLGPADAAPSALLGNLEFFLKCPRRIYT